MVLGVGVKLCAVEAGSDAHVEGLIRYGAIGGSSVGGGLYCQSLCVCLVVLDVLQTLGQSRG